MGTRGFIVYRIRGRYYVTYNHWDSYPTNLGRSIVGGIPVDREKFEGLYNISPSSHGPRPFLT